ncbi:MAG: hypothetical protein P8L66_07360, partial [Rhodospirillaceae bacterium]|nr:hypothetical protein [Rhodospirillaceae bacterium]
MAVENWRRDEPTFYNFLALERKSLSAPDPLGGIAGGLMSWDKKSESQTYIVEVPPGWKTRTDSKDASLELFVLRGDLALNGDSVGSGGYIHVPQLAGGGEVTSTAGAL